MRLNTDGTVTYDVTVAGLTPTVAHFHNAPAGDEWWSGKNITFTNNKRARGAGQVEMQVKH